MMTCHPKIQSFNSTVLEDVISFCKAYASEYADANATAILPIIQPWTKWNEDWDFAWNSAFNYATQGITTLDLYKGVSNVNC